MKKVIMGLAILASMSSIANSETIELSVNASSGGDVYMCQSRMDIWTGTEDNLSVKSTQATSGKGPIFKHKLDTSSMEDGDYAVLSTFCFGSESGALKFEVKDNNDLIDRETQKLKLEAIPKLVGSKHYLNGIQSSMPSTAVRYQFQKVNGVLK